jgi:hypothetical protein
LKALTIGQGAQHWDVFMQGTLTTGQGFDRPADLNWHRRSGIYKDSVYSPAISRIGSTFCEENAMQPLPHRSRRFAVELLERRELMAADMVLEWNQTLLAAVRTASTPPPRASRAMAIVHAAIYDAVNAIERTHEVYAVDVLASPLASREAAVAAAAHATLSSLFPTLDATFDAKLAASLATIPNGLAEDLGVDLGEHVATQLLALRANDGSTAIVPYTPGSGPGDWQPTPPANAPALLPNWPDVTPFAMTSGSQFSPDGIPALTSAEYTAAFNEVKSLGDINSATRTADQTDIALFWANGGGTATPPGHLNVLAAIVAEQRGNSLAENARLFAMLNVAMADAAIMSWDAKYDTEFWRPITGIRSANTDSNPDTAPDATWTPLIVTPPFPSYVSGHSSFSGAAAAVLKSFFGRDNIAFTLKSEAVGVPDRSFTSFSQAAQESADSRLYGGIHWRFDNEDGLTAGKALGTFVAQNYFERTGGSAIAGLVGDALVVHGTQKRETLSVVRGSETIAVYRNNLLLGRFDLDQIASIVIDAHGGNDVVRVSNEITLDAIIHGGDGSDWLVGGGGDDQIFGDRGHDMLFGRLGDDVLDGGEGNDLFWGGRGDDTFIDLRGKKRVVL